MTEDDLLNFVLENLRWAAFCISADLIHTGIARYRDWYSPDPRHRFQFYLGIWMMRIWWATTF